MTKEQSMIIALCRCALSNNPNEAVKHQILRLYKHYVIIDKGMAEDIYNLLNPKPDEMMDLKIVQSGLL